MTRKEERIASALRACKPGKSSTVGERRLWVKVLHEIIKVSNLTGTDMVRFIRISGGER